MNKKQNPPKCKPIKIVVNPTMRILVEHKKMFMLKSGYPISNAKIYLEIDYVNGNSKILTENQQEDFKFLGKRLDKWKNVISLINHAIEFAEGELK